MSNYSKTTNFAVKDGLSTGDPNKLIVGTDIDMEFNNIATAIATKADSSSVASLSAQNAISFSIASPGTGTTITNTNNGNAAYALFGLVNNVPNSLRFAISSSTYAGSFLTTGPAGQSAAIYTNSSNVPLSLGTNSTERLYVAPDGSVINLKATDVQINGASILSLQAVKASTTGRNNTTTLADDPDLIIAVPSAGTYEFRLLALITGTTTSAQGLKYQLVYTGTSGTIGYYTIGSINGAASTPTAAAGALNLSTHGTALIDGGAGASTDFDYVTGTFVASTTGNFKLQWAQANSNANNSNLKAGSFLLIRKLA